MVLASSFVSSFMMISGKRPGSTRMLPLIIHDRNNQMKMAEKSKVGKRMTFPDSSLALVRTDPAIDVVGHQQRADHELELVRRSACGLRRLAGMRGARRREKPSEDARWVPATSHVLLRGDARCLPPVEGK